MTKKGQGAVEYIIIIGVIILIALIVVASLGGLGIFDFSTSAQVRTTEISNRLEDVAFTYVVDDNGSVQVSLKSNTNKKITAYSMYWYNNTGGTECIVDFGNAVVRQKYQTFSNNSCSGLAGIAGETYEFDCTMNYEDNNGISHSVRGVCEGYYEES